jgi:protein-L-isoaspartate(D-aspartate) O-methyltransferase
MTDLAAIRRRYAARMMAIARVADARIEDAFSRVPREDFAGPPPWTLYSDRERAGAPDDPASLYADVLVALDAAHGINNGSPSLHALMLHRLGVRPGDRVLHAGIGTGYYTAILAYLVGPEGSVTAIEYDKALAARARANLKHLPHVEVIEGDAATPPDRLYDRIYVNFAVAHPARDWLKHLSEGGTLAFPLGTPRPDRLAWRTEHCALLRITATRAGFAVRYVSPCSFVFAQGALAGDAALRAQLHAAFVRGGVEFAQSLRLAEHGQPPPPSRTWFWTPEWSLSYDPPDYGMHA